MSRRHEALEASYRRYEGVLLETPDLLAEDPPIGTPWDDSDWPWGRVGAGGSVLIAIGLLYAFLTNTDKPQVLVFALLAANAAPYFWAASEYQSKEARKRGRIRHILEALSIHGQAIFFELAWRRVPEHLRNDVCWGVSAVLALTLSWQLVNVIAIRPRRRAQAMALASRDVFPRL